MKLKLFLFRPITSSTRTCYWPERFQIITCYWPRRFQTITCYLAELFRWHACYLAKLFLHYACYPTEQFLRITNTLHFSVQAVTYINDCLSFISPLPFSQTHSWSNSLLIYMNTKSATLFPVPTKCWHTGRLVSWYSVTMVFLYHKLH